MTATSAVYKDDAPFLRRVERVLRSTRFQNMWELLDEAEAVEEFGLDVVDLLLKCLSERWAEEQNYFDPADSRVTAVIVALEQALVEAGSAWSVDTLGSGEMGLVRRLDKPVADRILLVDDGYGNAGEHMRRAWRHQYGRLPDHSKVYDEVVKALEAALKPTVSPKDHAATLGKMIKALSDKPDKWSVVLGTVESLAARLDAVWRAQQRHGTDVPGRVGDVDAVLSEAVLHEGLTLLQWCRSGAFGVAAEGDAASAR